MNLEKRKCHKGSEHTGRSIQALCLEPNCTDDRLLCFYCIHESHHNHSIAYLISGLKSPLEMLNKNSHCQNPQKNLKYIENRFKRINKGWLKISDNLESGITQIEEKMTPQFNVIRETFKKNSVDHIIHELTSNEITSERIEEYVGMINMVKKYKFNNINKLKFMAFMIEHKLSRIFLNANKKINEIMNQVIEQTNELNFLDFNLEQLLKDRGLYLEITKNLTYCKITDFEINSLNYERLCGERTSQVVELYQIESNQIGQEGMQIDQVINGQNYGSSLIVADRIPIEEQLNQSLLQAQQSQKQSSREENSQQIILPSEQSSVHQIIDEKNQESHSQVKNPYQFLHSQVEESQPESHSNGFRSYQKSLEEKKVFNNILDSEQNKDQQKPQFGKNQYEEGEIWSNEEKSQKGEANRNEIPDQGSAISNKNQPQHGQSKNNSPEFEEYDFDSEKQFKEAYGVEENLKQISLQQLYNHQNNQQNNDGNQKFVKNEKSQQNDQIFEDKIIEEIQDLNAQQVQEDKQMVNAEDSYMSNHADQNQKQLNQDDKALSEFSCQFPSIDGNEGQDLMNPYDAQQNEGQIYCQHETQDQNFMPSYHFNLSINSSQMTLSNTFNLKQSHTLPQHSQTHEPIVFQMFNQNNLFDQFCSDNKGGQNQKKMSKNYDILKKYFVFYNGENSQDSSEQIGPVPPKRVKWVEDHKKELKQKSEQKPKKKTKLPETIEIIPNDLDFMDYPRTRTRSEKLKLAKLLEPTRSPDQKDPKENVVQKKGLNKQIIKLSPHQEQENNQISEQQQEDNNNSQEKDFSDDMIIEEAQEQQEQSEAKQTSKINEKSYLNGKKQDSQNDVPDEIEKESENDDDEKENIQKNENNHHQKDDQHFTSKLQKKQIPSVQKISNASSQNLLQSHQQSPSITSAYPPSFKLDKHALAEVSHSLLNKYERAFMKQENHKKQTDEEENEKKIKIKSVYLNGRFHEQIKKRLSLIDENYIEELTIYCDTMDCAINEDSVALICKMIKLTKLCVYWTYRLPKVLTKKLISSLPLLEELVLCELQDLDTEIANEIVSKLPNLRRFHYASDYMKNLDKMQENLEFLIDFVGTSTKLAPLFILSKLKNIETFWASDIDDIKQVKQILTKMKSLKQVSISAFEKRNKDLNSIFNVLSKRNTLICLSLQGLQFKEDSLVSIIHNNPNLNTLIINECPTVSNNTLAAVTDTCHDLQQLFLMLTDSLEGERIFELKKLRTLVVRACWSINVNKFRQGIKKLKNLRYLSLNMNNYWLNDDMLPSIALLPNLIFLNLDTTKVTDKGMQYLVGLTNLNTLICGRTEITATGLYKFLEKSKSQIKKLGLSRESNEELNRPQKINKHDVIYTDFEGKFLVRIGELLPELTHLSIGGFKNLYIENFATLDNLKCLQYKMQSLPEQTEKFLQTARLNLNANY